MLVNAGTATVPTTLPPGSQEEGGGAMEIAGDGGSPAPARGKAGLTPAPAEPSWGRVLMNTVKLWVLWRLHPAGFGQPGVSGRRQLTTRRWHLAVLALALAVGVTAALEFTGVFAGSAAPAARSSSTVPGRAGGRLSPAATARAEAAAWMAGQVSSNAIVACYPAMCAELQAQGVIAGRLMPLGPGSADLGSANLMVTSPTAGRQLAGKYAPAVIASFGSGATLIQVRVITPGGAAAYQAALRADLAARKSAGAQLLRNSHLQFTVPDAAQLRAGAVDSRLLATLAALSSQYSFRVTAFSDASPGAQVPFREVAISSAGPGAGAAGLAAARALVTAQNPPYLPAHATIVRPAAGQAALLIEFAAPSPLGLLTTVLTADPQRAVPPATAVSAAFPIGRAPTYGP